MLEKKVHGCQKACAAVSLPWINHKKRTPEQRAQNNERIRQKQLTADRTKEIKKSSGERSVKTQKMLHIFGIRESDRLCLHTGHSHGGVRCT